MRARLRANLCCMYAPNDAHTAGVIMRPQRDEELREARRHPDAPLVPACFRACWHLMLASRPHIYPNVVAFVHAYVFLTVLARICMDLVKEGVSGGKNGARLADVERSR